MRRVKLTKKPRKDRIRKMRQQQRIMLDAPLQRHVDLRNLATEGWSARNKPKFTKFVKNTRTGLRFGVRVNARNARKASISVYRMLNDKRWGKKATKVRRVILKKGYQRKTLPRRFGNFGKGGKVARVGKNISMEGIDAREWDEMANDALEPRVRRALKNGGKRGLRTA